MTAPVTPALHDELNAALNSMKKAFLWVLFFSFFINVMMLALPLYMLQVYSRILTTQSMDTLIFLTLITIFVLVIYAVLSAIRTYLLIQTSCWLDSRLTETIFDQMPDQLLESNEYAHQAFLDLATMRQFLTSAGVTALADLPWSSIYFFVIFLLSPWLGIFSILVGVVLFALAIMNEIDTKNDVIKSAGQIKKNQLFIQSLSRNSDTLQAMGLTKNLKKIWLERNHEALELQAKANRKGEHYLSWIKFFRSASQVLILALGAYLVLENQLTGGAMIAASILMSRALAPIEQAVTSWKYFIQFRDSYRRLKAYIFKPAVRRSGMSLPEPTGLLTLENVYYAYPGAAKHSLQQISLRILKGDLVAVLGASASGKTTLCRILLGILPPRSGKAKIDGGDIYNRDRSEIGPHLGYLPQDVELFPGTIKENIARMGNVEPDSVVEAAKKAGAHEMILSLPAGYETRIEGDKGLSAGQLQRLGLARALYKNPKVVVLDEPYSNLDREGEQALVQTLLQLKQEGVTTIIISHRIDLIQHVDKILVLHEGLLKMYGPRDQVLKELQKELEEKMKKSKGQTNDPASPPQSITKA